MRETEECEGDQRGEISSADSAHGVASKEEPGSQVPAGKVLWYWVSTSGRKNHTELARENLVGTVTPYCTSTYIHNQHNLLCW